MNDETPEPKPLSPEQLATLTRASDARIAPDGSKVIFVVDQASKEGEHETSALWIVDADATSPDTARQFSTGIANDHSPRWSPDGRRIAFLSDREERGKNSIYLMNADGGEGVRVFDQQGSMSGLRWSPDGTTLSVLFTEPETEEEKKRNEEKDDAVVWDKDQKYQRLWLIDPATKAATCVSPESRQVRDYGWSQDSTQLAICTTPNARMDDLFLDNELAIVSCEGGESRKILTRTGPTVDLIWSADNSKIAFRSAAGQVVHSEHVYVIDADGGEPTCLTEGYGGTIESLLSPDGGETLSVGGAEGVDAAVYRLSWDGELTAVLTGLEGWIDMPVDVSRDGSRMALVWQTPEHPEAIAVADVTDGRAGGLRSLTNFNAEIAGAALGTVSETHWQSDEGIEVGGILYLPHGYVEGQRYPAVALVHGGPTWAWSRWFHANWHDWGHMLAGRGFAVLLPNPRGSTGRGTEYMNANAQDIGGGEFRDMMSGLDALIERGIADPDRLGIGGWSWGGYMTAWSVTQTDRFKAAVMGAGLPNMVADNWIGDIPSANLSYFEQSAALDPDPLWERSAIRYIRNVKTPVLILHGAADERVNTMQGKEMYVALRTLGVPTEFVTYPREGHGIRERKHQIDLMNRVIGWYERYLLEGQSDDTQAQ
ncbi:MAG: S9 family peptidase [Thermomicrobiales bacterium]|nr:S9 family peptidase [Thermomicrobiales bacterium]